MSDAAFETEIAVFFADYVDAFARRDADALSLFWDEVGLFPSPGGNFAMERPAFRDHCEGLMRFYADQGVIRPEGTLLSATEHFSGVAEARVAYRMMGEGEAVIAAWEHVYILRRRDRWYVSLTIADGEMAAWTERGVRL